MTASYRPHEFDPPWCLGSGEVRERFSPLSPPAPLPWYHRNQTALMWTMSAGVVAVIAVGMLIAAPL